MIGLALWLFCILYMISYSLNIKRRMMITTRFFKDNVIKYGGLNTKGYKDITPSKLEHFKINDINELKDFVYEMFYELEVALNNLDYNVIRRVTSRELYHNYHTGISLNLKAGKKTIINDIERKKVIIYGIDSTTIKQVILAYIEVEYCKYMIDKNGDVISGNRNKKVTEKFELILRKDFEKEDFYKCPNCGAELTGNRCLYCRSTIKEPEFKISSIKRLVKIDEE